jgi:hypothetical protein
LRENKSQRYNNFSKEKRTSPQTSYLKILKQPKKGWGCSKNIIRPFTHSLPLSILSQKTKVFAE